MATVANARRTPGNEGVQPVEDPCCIVDERWHKRIVDVFSAGPEFIAWGADLVHLALEAASDRELTRVAGCHEWSNQEAVYALASALEELAEALDSHLTSREAAQSDTDAAQSDTDEVAELKRRLDAISPKLGEVKCKSVAVTDRHGDPRVRLYAGRDGANHGVEVLDPRGHMAACFERWDYGGDDGGGAELMFNDGGNFAIQIGVGGKGPMIGYASTRGRSVDRELVV